MLQFTYNQQQHTPPKPLVVPSSPSSPTCSPPAATPCPYEPRTAPLSARLPLLCFLTHYPPPYEPPTAPLTPCLPLLCFLTHDPSLMPQQMKYIHDGFQLQARNVDQLQQSISKLTFVFREGAYFLYELYHQIKLYCLSISGNYTHLLSDVLECSQSKF